MLLYGSRDLVGSSAVHAFSASNACFTHGEPSSKRVDGVGLDPKLRKLRWPWRCIQPITAKATASVAVVGKMSSIPRAAAIFPHAIHAAGGRD